MNIYDLISVHSGVLMVSVIGISLWSDKKKASQCSRCKKYWAMNKIEDDSSFKSVETENPEQFRFRQIKEIYQSFLLRFQRSADQI
jgi:hypothetical protein